MKNVLISTMMLALLILSACGGSDKQPDPPPVDNGPVAPVVQQRSVTMYKFRFNPNTLTIPAGSTVTFSNKDPAQHNVSISTLNVDQMIAPQKNWSYTFANTGTFKVDNRLANNTSMTMTITVQ